MVWLAVSTVPSLTLDTRLTRDERAYIQNRLERDQGKSALDRHITFRDIVNVFKDFKVILGGFMYLGLIVPAYSYAFFAPGMLSPLIKICSHLP